MQTTRRSFVQATSALLLVGLLALLGIVGMTFWLGERAQFYFSEVVEARDARGAAVELRNAVLAAESSQRGFLLTGNEIYLAPYDAAKAEAQRQLERLKGLLAPYRETTRVMQRLEAVISEKIQLTDTTIGLKRQRREDEVLAAVKTNRGKTLMDEANVFYTGLIRAADDRLGRAVQEQTEYAAWFRWFTVISGLVIFSVVGSAAIAVVRYTRELSAARDDIAALASGLEERVKERTADLMRVNEEIQRFAYIVTHDLRAPLVNIMGFTSELEGGVNSLQSLVDKYSGNVEGGDPVAKEARIALTEDLPEAIGFIRASTRKMDSLINAVLKLAREGRRTVRPEAVDLRGILTSSVRAIQHQVVESGGAINLRADALTIVSDRLALEQIFGNLLDNAVKYRTKGRPLRVDILASIAGSDRISVEVADNGRGIAEQDLERVFELFRRSGEHDQPGEGIGLAYVRTLVRKLGGDITVTSVLGGGTTFRIVLPRIMPPTEELS
jgi:signal transduction histidine kinase